MRVGFTDPVDGEMDAQPSGVRGLEVNGKSRDVVSIATRADQSARGALSAHASRICSSAPERAARGCIGV
jgi:hypothetical protein